MIQTIEGYYDNRVVVLEEQPKAKDKFSVYVMFIEDEIIPEKKTRKLGGLEGRLKVPDDFNEPLDDLKEYM